MLLSTQHSDQRSPDENSITSSVKEKIVESSEEGGDVAPENPWQNLSPWRRRIILVFLCASEFFDLFTAAGAIFSLQQIQEELKFTPGTIQWVITAYTLTFASFMLIAGRIADVYDPKPAFCAGFLSIGLFSIPIAIGHRPAILVLFRALQGIGAAMNVPSGLAMVSSAYPDPVDKGRALAFYMFSGSSGSFLGFMLSGVLTEYLSWRWIFYILAICVIPCSVISWFLLPFHPTKRSFRWHDLDIPGVVLLTISLCLFVFSVSLGNGIGWKTPQILVPLLFSFICFAIFCHVERIVANPAFPPRIWTTKSFTALVIYIAIYAWSSTGAQVQLIGLFQTLWHDSNLVTAFRCIPSGVCSTVSACVAGLFIHKANKRLLLIAGMLAISVGCVLFGLADTPDKYWTYVLPGVIITFFGGGLALTGSLAFVMNGAGMEDTGVVSAVMQTAVTVGITVGLTVVTTICEGVSALKDPTNPNPTPSFAGYQVSFFSLIASSGLTIIFVFIFVRD